MSSLQHASASRNYREFALVALLALFAAVRIFICAAVLPPFNNVDEPEHYDLIRKYATGFLPGFGVDHFDHDPAREIVMYTSPEYVGMREEYPDGVPMPYWTLPPDVREAEVERIAATYTARANREALSPPVYYGVAALWHHLGRFIGLRDGGLVYWLRFFNVLVYPAFLILSYFFVRRFYPDQSFLRISVPILLAFFPQDVFFTINSDVVSPLLFTGALYLLLEWADRHWPYKKLGVAAGLVTALTFLVKYSNVAVLVAMGMILARKAWRLLRHHQLGRRGGDFIWPVLCVCLPVAGWLVRNLYLLGDLTGTSQKLVYLDWKYKPLGELGNHPLFTIPGSEYFWSRLIANTWQGELVWFMDRPTWVAADRFFISVTVVFLAAATVRWIVSLRTSPPSGPTPDGLFLVIIGASVVFLMVLSLLYDFGGCIYPSRYRPYFVSGRLIIGALLPFMVLLVRGIEFVFAKWAPRIGPALMIAVIVVVSIIAPLKLLLLAAQSQYNWLHLP